MQLEFMDLDIWLNATPENAELVLKSVTEFGFGSFKLSKEDFTKPGSIIQLGYPPLRIDLLTEIDGVIFDDCYQNRKETYVDDLHVNFIGYQDLLKNKYATGRPKDLGDIDNLK